MSRSLLTPNRFAAVRGAVQPRPGAAQVPYLAPPVAVSPPAAARDARGRPRQGGGFTAPGACVRGAGRGAGVPRRAALAHGPDAGSSGAEGQPGPAATPCALPHTASPLMPVGGGAA